jgi:hypothetical protein
MNPVHNFLPYFPKIKEDEMHRACSMHGKNEYAYRILVRKPEGKRQLAIHGTIILKWIFKNQSVRI